MRQGKSAASLLMAQSKFIFTWREEGSNEESKRLNLFPTKKIVPDIEPILPRKNNQIGDIVVFLRKKLRECKDDHGSMMARASSVQEPLKKRSRCSTSTNCHGAAKKS